MSDALTPAEWRDIIEGENEDGIELAHAVRFAQAGRPMACAQVALRPIPGRSSRSCGGLHKGSPDAAMLAELMRRIAALQCRA